MSAIGSLLARRCELGHIRIVACLANGAGVLALTLVDDAEAVSLRDQLQVALHIPPPDQMQPSLQLADQPIDPPSRL